MEMKKTCGCRSFFGKKEAMVVNHLYYFNIKSKPFAREAGGSENRS